MIKRVRDKIQNYKPQGKVSADDWADIENRFKRAKRFFSDENPIYIILQESLKTAEDMILENRIREVREISTIAKGFRKIFITPKKIQDDELVGQIKFIRGLLLEIQSWIDRHNEIEQKEAEDKVIIERDEKK